MYFIYVFLTLAALIALLYSCKKHSEQKIGIAVWFNILAILVLYKLAGGEILGMFFNYTNSAMYSLNLLILIASLSYVMLYSKFINTGIKGQILVAMVSTILLLVGCILLINVWINAYFIENRKINLPILQVATLGNTPYCNYSYLFYKMDPEGKTSYLCPNYYFLLPRIGRLKTTPKFIAHQFHLTQQKDNQSF